jgi:DNA-binding MarR family transcriptional regulator
MSTPTPEEALSVELRTAVGRLYSRFRSERLEGELGDAALGVLIRLLKVGPQSLTDLSEHARVTPGSMSQTVNRLTEGGYAMRAHDPHDGRKVLFTLTPQGEALATTTRAQIAAWLEAQIAQLSPDERAILAQAAAIMRRMADS